MGKRVVTGLLLAAVLVACGGVAAAAEPSKALYVKTIEKYPAPKLAAVGGREYKFLVDPAKTKGTPEEAFKDVWGQVKAAAAKTGFTVTEKEKSPLKIELSTKEYFDTADQALWKKGYIIRVTNKYKDGKPDTSVALTVKTIDEDALVTLAAPLAIVGGTKAKTEAEGNVGIGPEGKLKEFVEKGSTVTVPLADLGKLQLADFAKFVPEVAKLGLPADAVLVGKKAHSYRVRPGYVVLPGTEPCGVSMEGWTDKEGGTPYLYDFSYGYGDLDFYNVATTHEAGEQFLLKVLQGELGALAMPDSEKWAGSKVRKLMNRPVAAKGEKAAAAAAPAAAAAAPAAAAAAAPKPASGPPVDPLDAKFGVASQPAYVKHYEADKDGKVLINPYLQVASKDFPAILEAKMAPYNWVIDQKGRVSIIPEAAHPLGRTYPNGFYRPEDKSQRKPGTRENYGHVSALAGAPGRISGEILYDKDTKTFTVNNKSGRYSKHNSDRTPDQLVNAATLIRDVVDPGATAWGPVYYLLDYAPESVSEELMKSPKLQYDDPKKKSRPHVVVMPGGASAFKGEKPAEAVAAAAAKPAADAPKAEKNVAEGQKNTDKPAAEAAKPAESAKPAEKPAKAKKPKAAQNDDPS